MATPLRKAAILLLSLPEDDAAKVLAKLDQKEVEMVTVELARLSNFSADEQEQVIGEFAGSNPAGLGGRGGSMQLAKSLVEKAFGKQASSTIDSIRQQIEALPFAFLQKVDSQNLLTFITDEHPQTIALILCHLPPQRGAEILAGLPADRQLSVVRRVATMGQTSPEIIQEVERGLEFRMASVMSQSFEKSGGVATVAEILNVTDRATERTLLESLGQEDAELVNEIRRLMFVFEDMTKFSDKDMQLVLKNVDSNQWALSLKGASEELKQKVLGNMSQRARELMIEEMSYLGAVKLSAVEQMQQQIVDIVRRMEDSGEVDLHAGDESEAMIS